jgi:heme-degrading monooxygenase HmoA
MSPHTAPARPLFPYGFMLYFWSCLFVLALVVLYPTIHQHLTLRYSIYTMSAVTEVVALHVKEGVEAKEVGQLMESVVLKQPGALHLRYSKRHEDAEQVSLFIDWESLSAHQAFTKTEAYGPFLEEVGKLVRSAPTVYHVPFVPFPPTVLNNDGGRGKTKVSEVVHAHFPLDIDLVKQQEVVAQAQQFIDVIKADGNSGESAHGWVLEDLEYKGEKTRVLLMILGWDSVEAHVAYRDTEDFAKNIPLMRTLPLMKGMQMWHVCNSEATK